MPIICKRLRRGEDLLGAIQALAEEHRCGRGWCCPPWAASAACGCGTPPASPSREVEEDVEIVSLTGTLSAKRTHLHIACSREDLTCLGGHLVPGCVVNTTCELVVGVLSGWEMGVEQDGETGYDEIVFMRD